MASAPIDTFDRDAVIAAYSEQFKPFINVPVEWTGSVEGCVAGTVSEQTSDATLSVLNYLRNMAGVQSVELDSALNDRAQQAALMMQAENSLSHFPGVDWACYSEAGAQGAGASNLYLGVTGPAAMVGYVEDPGRDNYAVGHRRWLLNPHIDRMGIGSTSNANALYVVGPHLNRPAPQWITWPPQGYVPKELVFPRWSVSRSGADFADATVQMTVHGQSVPADLQPVVNGFAQNTLVWEPNIALDMVSAEEFTVDVLVENVRIGGLSTSFQYTVTPIHPGPPVQTIVAAGDDRVAMEAGVQYTYFDVFANDDLTHDDWAPATIGSLRATIVGNPSHGRLLRAVGNPGIFFYFPNEEFVGVDSFSYRIADLDAGRVSNLANVQITVGSGASSSNRPPTISSIANLTITQDSEPVTIAFSIGDPETNPADLTVTATSANQTLIPNQNIKLAGSGANRTVTVTPGASQTGADTITLWVSNGHSKTFESFVVTVEPSEGPSTVLYDSVVGTYWGQSLLIDLLDQVRSSELPLDPTSLVIETEPEQGSVTMLGEGRIRYDAAEEFVGEDQFEFTVADIEGRVSNRAIVLVRVVASPLQNPLLDADVNGDGNVTPLDALLILGQLARAQREGISGGVPVELLVDQSPRFYYDTDGNGRIEPLDALLVLNRIARDNRLGAGELLDVILPPAPLPHPEPLQAGDHQAAQRFTDVPLQLRFARASAAWQAATVDRALGQLDETSDEEVSVDAQPEPLEHWLGLLAFKSGPVR